MKGVGGWVGGGSGDGKTEPISKLQGPERGRARGGGNLEVGLGYEVDEAYLRGVRGAGGGV